MSEPENPPHPAFQATGFMDLQLAAARQLRWYPDQVSVTGDEVLMSGWALSLWDA